MILEDVISPKTGEIVKDTDEALGAEEPDMFGNPEYITGTAAMNMLRFSRHTFEKCVGGGIIPQIILTNKTVYDKADIDRFMDTEQYEAIFNGCVDERNLLNDLTSGFNLDYCNSFGMNALVSNYLNKIFPFAANSNRNSSVLFDGYVEIGGEKEAFVEVDEKDALECCRNLLGDFLLYEGQFSFEINMGLIVLKEIPPIGNNIYTVIEKMHIFPRLERKEIYFTTFSFLRHLFLNTTMTGSYIDERMIIRD